MELYYDELSTPVGPLLIIASRENVIRIDYGIKTDMENVIEKWLARYFNTASVLFRPDKLEHVKNELRDYFAGKRKVFTFETEFHGTPFQRQVWQALYDTIPYGKTKTYKEIAEEIGNQKAVRAVGGAVNKNPLSIVVPCHRVVGANGKLVGYNGGLDKKEYLLNLELTLK